MSKSFQSLLESCEAGVRAGQAPQTKERLLEINSAQIPREFRLPFANLCRRIGLNDVGLRILSPLVVEGRSAGGEKPTSAELAEYAVLLQRIGAIDEALKILEGLNPARNPEVWLFKSFCHFNRWEYFESIPHLRAYISAELPDYSKLIGRVNLAAALVVTRENEEALQVLAQNIEEARGGGFRRLEANCYEIRAQSHIQSGHVEKAVKDLEQAFKILSGEGTVAEISILKWRAVVEAKRSATLEPLTAFRVLALKFGEWEAVRHTDLNILSQKYDEALFHFHLFGSPWLGYREGAQRSLGRIISEPHFDYGQGGGRLLNLNSCALDGAEAFPVGSKLHRALAALTLDFYRPVSSGTMFSSLFPGEYFDVFSSPNRVHQVLFRLRRWLNENNLPVEVEQSKDGYWLRLNGPLSLRVPYERREPDSNMEFLRRLHTIQREDPYFSVRELSQDLGLTPAVARRFLNWAVEQKFIEKTGASSTTRYRLIVSLFKAA